jgi:hypothetical protein
MDSIYLTARDLINKSSNPSSDFIVVGLEGTQVLLDKPASAGRYLSFNNGNKGITLGSYQARLFEPIKKGSISWANYQPLEVERPIFKVLSDINMGDLSVSCALFNPSKQVKGWVGWTLYRNEVPVLIGNDFSKVGVCDYSGGSGWPVGKYRLEITQFEPGCIPSRSGKVSWVLYNPSDKLSAGNPGDSQPSVELLKI